tara:strand:- start:130318 stop:130944 length:627 start_codon:yes stop_codon:yes gene_type:complete
MNELVEIKNLNLSIKRLRKFSFRELFQKSMVKDVFTDFNLSLGSKNYLILGDNGVGKTTLLRLLAGIIQPDSGEIVIKQKSTFCISQNIIFFSRVSIYENLNFASHILCQKSLSFELAKEILHFADVDINLNDISNGLSTGMSSRIMIALCLMNGEKTVFFDETFANVSESYMLKVLTEAQKKGIQLIIVSHYSKKFENFEFEKININ